jgi:hypothetical protein
LYKPYAISLLTEIFRNGYEQHDNKQAVTRVLYTNALHEIYRKERALGSSANLSHGPDRIPGGKKIK